MMCVYAFQEIRDMTQPWPRIKVRRAIQLSLRALRVPGCSVCVWFQSDAPGEDYLPPPTIKISGRFLRCKKDSKSGTRVGQCVCMYRVTTVCTCSHPTSVRRRAHGIQRLPRRRSASNVQRRHGGARTCHEPRQQPPWYADARCRRRGG